MNFIHDIYIEVKDRISKFYLSKKTYLFRILKKQDGKGFILPIITITELILISILLSKLKNLEITGLFIPIILTLAAFFACTVDKRLYSRKDTFITDLLFINDYIVKMCISLGFTVMLHLYVVYVLNNIFLGNIITFVCPLALNALYDKTFVRFHLIDKK